MGTGSSGTVWIIYSVCFVFTILQGGTIRRWSIRLCSLIGFLRINIPVFCRRAFFSSTMPNPHSIHDFSRPSAIIVTLGRDRRLWEELSSFSKGLATGIIRAEGRGVIFSSRRGGVRFYTRVGFSCDSRAVRTERFFFSLSGNMSTAWSVSDKGLCARAWKGELL